MRSIRLEVKQRLEVGPAPALCEKAIPGQNTVAHQYAFNSKGTVGPVKHSEYSIETSIHPHGIGVLWLAASWLIMALGHQGIRQWKSLSSYVK